MYDSLWDHSAEWDSTAYDPRVVRAEEIIRLYKEEQEAAIAVYLTEGEEKEMVHLPCGCRDPECPCSGVKHHGFI